MGRDSITRLSEASTTLLDDDYFSSRRGSIQLMVTAHISSNRNIGKVTYISICFLILFTGFTSIQNLMPEIYDQLGHGSLGQITLLTLYAFFGISVFIVPSLLEYLSHKTGIVIGSLTYIFPVVAGALTTECTVRSDWSWCGSEAFIYTSNIVAASITGFGAAIIWLSANRYITACASESNKGRFMGVFFGFFSCSNVLGNLIAGLVIENFGQFGFYITTSILIGIAIIMIFFTREVPKYDEETSNESIKEKASKIIRLAMSYRMRVLLPYLFFVGLVLAIYSGFEFRIITHPIPDSKDEHQDFITSMVFLAQGVMSMVSSYSAGKLDDVLTRKKVLNIFNAGFVLAISISFVAYFTSCLGLTFLMGILWGIGYAGASTLTGVIMAKDFYGSIEAYAVLQLTSNIGTIVGFILCISIRDISVFLFAVLGFFVLSLISTCCYRPKDKTSPLGTLEGEYEDE